MIFAWLQDGLDPTRGHAIAEAAAWHARLMVLAWSVLFPVGIFAARFFKVTARQNWPAQLDNKAWWRTHLASQYTAGLCVLAALWLVWKRPALMHLTPHTLLGWATIACCTTQFLGGWLRGSKGGPTEPRPDGSWTGDHYDMSLRRRIFEWLHKTLGYVAVLLSILSIATGLWHVNAPRWMALGIALWWCFVLSAFVILQRRGQAIDTYQAIWGADPKHPGNRRPPIGWGIRRLSHPEP